MHAAQAAGALAYVPTGHVDAVYAQEAAPASLNAPAAHGRHVSEELAPKEGEKVPAGHSAQAVAGGDRWEPGAQTVMVRILSLPVSAT
jgi:hypothetical protein